MPEGDEEDSESDFDGSVFFNKRASEPEDTDSDSVTSISV